MIEPWVEKTDAPMHDGAQRLASAVLKKAVDDLRGTRCVSLFDKDSAYRFFDNDDFIGWANVAEIDAVAIKAWFLRNRPMFHAMLFRLRKLNGSAGKHDEPSRRQADTGSAVPSDRMVC